MIGLEPAQASLMERILGAEMIKADHLEAVFGDEVTVN